MACGIDNHIRNYLIACNMANGQYKLHVPEYSLENENEKKISDSSPGLMMCVTSAEKFMGEKMNSKSESIFCFT